MQLRKFLTLLLVLLALSSSVKAIVYIPSHCESTCWWDDIWVEGEFLYWKPCISDSRVAVTATLPATTSRDQLHFMHFDWEPGVRASIGKDNLWCGWNIWGSYTHIKPDGTVDLTAPTGSVIFSDYIAANFGTAVAAFGYDTALGLSQKHRFTYQTWEVLLSKKFQTPCCLAFDPFFGVQGLILNQKLNVSLSDNAGSVFGPTTINFKSTIDYHGYGLKAGMGVLYPICGGFNAYALPSFSMVYGNKHLNESAAGFTSSTSPIAVNQSSKGKSCVFIPGFDLQIGFTYVFDWCNRLIGLKAGWEFLQWSNIPQINRLNTSDDTLTLGFQGLTVSGFIVF